MPVLSLLLLIERHHFGRCLARDDGAGALGRRPQRMIHQMRVSMRRRRRAVS